MANKILKELYLQTGNPFHCQPIQQNVTEKPFTTKELKRVFQKVPLKKAPGFDGIDLLFSKTYSRNFPIRSLVLQQMYFFTVLPKSSQNWNYCSISQKKVKQKTKSNPIDQSHNYQLLGKILEKLLLERFNHHFRKNNSQHPLQYGFTVNKSSEEAIGDLLEKIEKARNSNNHALLISIDIKGAFDNLQYHSIKNCLHKINYHSNITETLVALTDRKIIINIPLGPATLLQYKGCQRVPVLVLLSGTLWQIKFFQKFGPREFICKHLQMISSS
ncbi:hypothetical protein AVEN_262317-1 [Araneus ventricosus]|uniref:Reverse transcriptase domain-containing protein n=1 Tax=Araneus ventricosus TaxID=182803 RepID=A0A4Y2IDS9_ARAVE|nr:hypothetical protein AVEN_262317-1 [Araneus ventricosus]